MRKLLIAATAMMLGLGGIVANAAPVNFSYNGVFTDGGASSALNYTATFNVTNFAINIPAPGFIDIDNVLTLQRTNSEFIGSEGEVISATFNFYAPSVASGTVPGVGTETKIFGLVSNGLIDWGVANVNFGSGNSLLIALEDTPYNFLTLKHHGINIDGRFTAVGEFDVNPVPLPAAVWMFLSALGVGGLLMRRRRNYNKLVAA